MWLQHVVCADYIGTDIAGYLKAIECTRLFHMLLSLQVLWVILNNWLVETTRFESRLESIVLAL